MPVPNNLYPIQSDRYVGKLCVAARPRGHDWLEDDLAVWRKQGVTHVVSLLEDQESELLGLLEEAKYCHSNGMQFQSFPMPDREVPSNRESFSELVNQLHEELNQGERIVVHCRQGIGRSGMLAAAVLNSFEIPLIDSLERVSLARGLKVPETDQQLRWLMDHAVSHAV